MFTLNQNALSTCVQRVKTGSNEGRPHFFPFLPAAFFSAGAAALTGAALVAAFGAAVLAGAALAGAALAATGVAGASDAFLAAFFSLRYLERSFS